MACANFKHWFAASRAHLPPPAAPAIFSGAAGGAGGDGFVAAQQHFDEVKDVELFYTLERNLERQLAPLPGAGGNAAAPQAAASSRGAEVGTAPGAAGSASASDAGGDAARSNGDGKAMALQRQLAALFLAMPRDLQQALMSNPARQQLLLRRLSCWSADQRGALEAIAAALH